MMTRNQLQLAELREDIRHNRASEGYNERVASAQEYNAQTQRIESKIHQEQLKFSQTQAESAYLNAMTNARQADIAAQNADINRINAQTNSMNAVTNRQNAESNAITASANEMNANTNASSYELDYDRFWKADLQKSNAQTYYYLKLGELQDALKEKNYAEAQKIIAEVRTFERDKGSTSGISNMLVQGATDFWRVVDAILPFDEMLRSVISD